MLTLPNSCALDLEFVLKKRDILRCTLLLLVNFANFGLGITLTIATYNTSSNVVSMSLVCIDNHKGR
jgi:hypothetical protein